MNYYDVNSKLITMDISSQLLKNYGKEKPVIVCLGSSKVLSDMVGVFVADILKKRDVDVIVFGGSRRNANCAMAKQLSSFLDSSRILFVDSGALSKTNVIMFSQSIILNDGTKLNSPCIVAGTITIQNQKYNFANATFGDIKKYSTIIADSICEYFSYIDLLKQS